MDSNNQTQMDQAQPVVQPQGPVSIPTKEAEPLTQPVEIRPSDAEPQLHPEVQRVGVEVVRQHPEVTSEQKLVGIQPAKESVPVPTAPSGTVQLPMTQVQAQQASKTASKTSSLFVLAILLLKHFKRGLLKA